MTKDDAYYLAEAVHYLLPNTGFSFTQADYLTIKWDITPASIPTQSEIDAAIEQVKANEVAAANQAQADKVAATAKLEALGLTADDLKALGL